jgi:putative SOS response-associated peptidase YedK
LSIEPIQIQIVASYNGCVFFGEAISIMCDLFTSPGQSFIEQTWCIDRSKLVRTAAAARDVSPSNNVPVIWQSDESDNELELLSARWGLIPHSWASSNPPAGTHVAMSETAANNRLLYRPLRSARCIVPAAAWYDWAETALWSAPAEVDYRYQIHQPDGGLMGFAGVISWWVPPRASAPIVSCSLLTAAAAPSIAHLGTRMPIALEDSAQEAWLEPGMKDPARALEILREGAVLDFTYMRLVHAAEEAASLPGLFGHPGVQVGAVAF